MWRRHHAAATVELVCAQDEQEKACRPSPEQQALFCARIEVRELSSEKKVHYHMVLFLDGNKTNNPYQHFQNARIVLKNICGDYGCINECNDGHRNGIMLERNMTPYNELYEVLRQISYLAKTDQKQDVPGKTFFYSKVPVLPLSNEDISRCFQSLFHHLTFGMTNWYAE